MADVSAMQAMAARLMGGARPAPPAASGNPATQPATIPRSLPAVTAALQAPTPPAKTPEVVITSPSTTLVPTLTFSPTTNKSSALTERNMKTDTGPSLRGDPAQLKLARQFMDELSGGKKATHGRVQPSRRDSASSTTSSVRSSRAREVTSPTPGFNHLIGRNPPPPGRDNTVSGWQGFSSGPNNKSTPAITVTQPKAPLAASQAAAVVTSPQGASTTPSPIKGLETPTQQPIRVQTPDTPVKHEAGTGLFARQVATMNNTFAANASNNIAPHLRKKAEAAVPKMANETVSKPNQSKDTIPQVLSTAAKEDKKANVQPAAALAPSTTANNQHKAQQEMKLEPKITQGPAATAFSFNTSTETTSPALPTVNGNDIGTKINSIDRDTPSPPPSSTSATRGTGQDDNTKKLAWVIAELQDLRAKVNQLEVENLELNQKAERLQESDDRRKFLGTDDARAPFTVTITNPHGQSHTFQASKEKKVKQLILDARFMFKLDKDSCKGPTLSFQGKQVGHAMMVGELGVVQGSTLTFSYEGADEEDL